MVRELLDQEQGPGPLQEPCVQLIHVFSEALKIPRTLHISLTKLTVLIRQLRKLTFLRRVKVLSVQKNQVTDISSLDTACFVVYSVLWSHILTYFVIGLCIRTMGITCMPRVHSLSTL